MSRSICATRKLATVICVATSSVLSAQDKKAVEQQYLGKYLVVLQEGLAVGLCSEKQVGLSGPAEPIITVGIEHGAADYLHQYGTFLRPLPPSPGCASVVPEPIHKGEVLKVQRAAIIDVYGRRFQLWVSNVSPHAIQRGVGAFEHQSLEQGNAVLIFKLEEKDSAKEALEALSVASPWFSIFDTQDAAAKLGNTASGAFVREIRTGMTVGEVETVLGPPQTKIVLTEKLLYKYKEMTIEFRNGKVSDVR